MEKFVIIDGNSLINRAYYGMPPLKSLSGKPCGAIFGFVNMMLSVVLSEKPKYLVCVFDAGKHTFRHNLYAEYKGTRGPMPEDLYSQLVDLKELLKAMGILTLEQSEIEADDIVGTRSRKCNEECILIAGDKDLLQLVNSNTTVWLTQKGISNVLKVTPEVLQTEFGIKPYQVIELKAIMGDSSDNIPGVAGIGKVGANKLIEEFDNLDNIYANVDKLATGVKNKLEVSKEIAYLSKQLATIKLDVDLKCELKDCEFSLPFNKETYLIMQDLDFKSLLKREELFEHSYNVENKKETIVNIEKVEIDNQENFDNMLDVLKESFAVLSDTMSLKFATGNKEFTLYKSGEIFNSNINKIKEIFENENLQKICFETKDLMHELSNYNIALNNFFDVSIAIYIANEMDAEISLNDAVKLNQLDIENGAVNLITLKEIYVAKLIQSLQLKLYADIELPLVKVLFDMEKTGIKIDAGQIKNLSLIILSFQAAESPFYDKKTSRFYTKREANYSFFIITALRRAGH